MKYLEIKGKKKSNPKLVKLIKNNKQKVHSKNFRPRAITYSELLNSLSSPIKNITE